MSEFSDFLSTKNNTLQMEKVIDLIEDFCDILAKHYKEYSINLIVITF